MELKTSGIIPEHGKKRSGETIHNHKSHKNHNQPHQNLSKKHLQMWMTSTDNMQEELVSMVEHTQARLNEIEKKHSVTCNEMVKRMENFAKYTEEQKEDQNRKEESDKIIFVFMASKIDQFEKTLQTIQHQQ